jgi:hypothetical protein
MDPRDVEPLPLGRSQGDQAPTGEEKNAVRRAGGVGIAGPAMQDGRTATRRDPIDGSSHGAPHDPRCSPSRVDRATAV